MSGGLQRAGHLSIGGLDRKLSLTIKERVSFYQLRIDGKFVDNHRGMKKQTDVQIVWIRVAVYDIIQNLKEP